MIEQGKRYRLRASGLEVEVKEIIGLKVRIRLVAARREEEVALWDLVRAIRREEPKCKGWDYSLSD